MNHDNDQMNEHDDQVLGDAGLRWQLRGLRQDLPPRRDLWTQIHQRIEQGIATAPTAVARPAMGRRWAPFALAASLLLAVGLAWQLRPLPAPSGAVPALADAARDAPALDVSSGRLISREAEAMTREYGAAMHELRVATEDSTPSPTEAATLRTLDRSAAQIRTALNRDPDARFLLERLRRTYAQRLALTQRGILS